MERKNLCAEFKAALEKEFGWIVLRMDKDEYDFLFELAVPENDIYWASCEDDGPEDSVFIPGLRVEGFGKGRILCSMPIHYAVREYVTETELPLDERVRIIFEEHFKGILEVLSFKTEEHRDDEEEYVTVRARILPGKSFNNDFAFNIVSINDGVLEFNIEDFDISGIPEEE